MQTIDYGAIEESVETYEFYDEHDESFQNYGYFKNQDMHTVELDEPVTSEFFGQNADNNLESTHEEQSVFWRNDNHDVQYVEVIEQDSVQDTDMIYLESEDVHLQCEILQNIQLNMKARDNAIYQQKHANDSG